MPWQKIETHLHTREDVLDGPDISYTIFEFLDLASKEEYSIICWTNHYRMPDRDVLMQARLHAERLGIVLIPGVEHEIGGKDILLYFDYDIDHNRIIGKIKTLSDAARMKREGMVRLVGAPHPFFPMKGLGEHTMKNAELFDFFEYHWFYAKTFLPDYLFNRNTKGASMANRMRKPMLAGGDLHFLDEFGKECSYVRSDKDRKSFFGLFEGIRNHRLTNEEIRSLITIDTSPLSVAKYLKYTGRMLISFIRYLERHRQGIRPGAK